MNKLHPEKIATLALQSLLAELSATPKPGLIDRNNSGAHQDMDFFMMQKSASVLAFYFLQFAEIGRKFHGNAADLFTAVRDKGKIAEDAMFKATSGINTHKGALFSFGIICAAAGYLSTHQYSQVLCKDICDFIREMTEGICRNELVQMKLTGALTHGEAVYLKYQVPGIRGEVENGFPHVRNFAYPILAQLLKEGRYSMDTVFSHTLLYLMANVVDTNVLYRHQMETVTYVQQSAQSVLQKGGCLTDTGLQAVYELDQDFIKKGISPGGCADLLAVTYFLYSLENCR